MSKFDVIYQNIGIDRILSFQTIQMPIFQRRYSWGIEKQEDKAQEYFREFLSNRGSNNFYGIVFIHTKQRYNYSTDEAISVYLSDGQHRLVTVILSALCIKDVLSQVVATDQEDMDLIEEVINSNIIKLSTQSNVEAVIDENLNSKLVIKFIEESLFNISKLETDILQIENDIKLKKQLLKQDKSLTSDQRETKKSELERDRRNQIKSVKQKVNLLINHPIIVSYNKIKDYLMVNTTKVNDVEKREPRKIHSILKISENFVDRVEKLSACVITLHPEQGKVVHDWEIENEAFYMFRQMNGLSTPLNAGDLLRAYITQHTKETDNIRDFFNDSQKIKLLKSYSIHDIEDFANYIHKVSSTNWPEETYTWVRNVLNDGKEQSRSQKYIASWTNSLNYLDTISQTYESCNDVVTKEVFKIYISTLNTLRITAFLTKAFVSCQGKTTQSQLQIVELRKIIKTLIFLSIMTTYIEPNSGKRPNISRDLHSREDISSCLKFIAEHFLSNNDISQFKLNVEQHVKTFTFGQEKYRRLSKLLLIIADANKPGKNTQIGVGNNNYNYEHVFPQSYTNTELSNEASLLPATIYNEYDLFISDPDLSDVINLIGNGALLEENTNKSYQNSSPYIKLQKTQTSQNAWWPENLKDLQNSNGLWVKKQIEDRSGVLAKDIVDWLFSDFTQTDLM